MQRKTLVSIILFTYNQEDYVRDAVSSILKQDYSPLQIIVSDDCSSDKTYELAKEIIDHYQGPHNVILERNENNLGVGAHVNKLMAMTKGELIVAAAGDDISFPYRVTETVKVWEENGREPLSLCSEMLTIDGDGQKIGKLPVIKAVTIGAVMRPQARWIYGASHCWHKSLFEVFGPLRNDVVSEDKAIGFRSLLLGKEIVYIAKPLVKYRFHETSITKGFSDKKKLQQKISSANSYIADLKYLKNSSTVEWSGVYEKALRDYIAVRDDFVLRERVLTTNPVNALYLLLKCGRKFTLKQKRMLLRNSLSTRFKRGPC